MSIPRRLTLIVLLGLAAPVAAGAQDYPTRPVTLVVPFPTGGSTTLVARIVADRMSPTLGQSIVVENRGGAGGTVGARSVARSAPDGYTILLGYTGTLAIGPTMYPNAGFDPRRDFAPIGRIGLAPAALVVHPSLPVHSVGELITYAKAHPGELNYGSAGIGTVGHLAGAYLASTAGLNLVHVPYRGTGPALTDLLGGHIPMMFSPIPSVIGHVGNGALRALAVTSAERSRLLPDLPTVAEAALPGYEAALRYGLVAPTATPPAIITRLNAELNAALAIDEVRQRIVNAGAEPVGGTPEDYAGIIDREETMWASLIKSIGLRVESDK